MIDHATMLARVRVIVEGTLAVDMASWAGWTEAEERECMVLVLYEMGLRQERQCKARKRALGLFRSWLSPAERSHLVQRREVRVHGSAGGYYAVRPHTGSTARLERHGSRWFVTATYCLHPPDILLPAADIALAHMLLLRTDEPAFLATSNETRRKLWDGDWLKCLNRARREREMGFLDG
jgi:hypothetical protein